MFKDFGFPKSSHTRDNCHMPCAVTRINCGEAVSAFNNTTLSEMADSFEAYEADFHLAIQEAQAKFASIGSDVAQRRVALQDIELATDEALEVIDQMNIEVQKLPVTSRSAYNQKIREYRAQVDGVKQKMRELADEEDRQQLFGLRYRDEDNGVYDTQRKQLLSNNASLERTSDRLRDSQRIANETESIGGNILNDLRAQREQIVNLRNVLLAADSYVDNATQTLKEMSRRLVANKFISYAIIAVLILLIFLVLASKFR